MTLPTDDPIAAFLRSRGAPDHLVRGGLAAMVDHIAAVKRFYGQLTPSQQKAFDAMHEGHGGGMGHRMGAHGMMGHMPGHPG